MCRQNWEDSGKDRVVKEIGLAIEERERKDGRGENWRCRGSVCVCVREREWVKPAKQY